MITEKNLVVTASPEAAEALNRTLAGFTLEDIEAAALAGLSLPILSAPAWQELSSGVREVFRHRDQVLIRGLDPDADPRSLIAAISILGTRFLTYRKDQVVKVFSMSPWSRDLAHAGAEGFFHTDLNASPAPPALTGIQCVKPDPGAPEYGHNRVARLGDLLEHLHWQGAEEAIAFMTTQDVEMANERSPILWRGKVVDGGVLRFHPETIRAASLRQHKAPPESILTAIQKAAFAVSTPVNLERGDMLLFSNHRTLHYRSECTVRFIRFPLEFEARQIHVLHVHDEHPAD
jgi:hypothetical protein